MGGPSLTRPSPTEFGFVVSTMHGAQIGWDVRSGWLHVWIKKLLDSDKQRLDAALAEPVKKNAADSRFTVSTEAELKALKDVLRRHVCSA